MVQHYIEKTDDGYEIKKIFDVIDGRIRYTEEALEKMEKTNFYSEKGICKNCGKVTEKQIDLYEIVEVNGKPVLLDKKIKMCSDKCCEEYVKHYEKGSVFIKTNLPADEIEIKEV